MPRRTYPAALARSDSFRPPKRFEATTPEQRMDRILDIAEQRFIAGGIARTSLHDIAASASLPAGSVLATFGKKDVLLEHIIDRHMDRLIDRVGAYTSDAETTDPEERLGQAIAALLTVVWAYRNGQRLHVAVMQDPPASLVASLKLRQRHLVYVYAGLIAAAVPEPEAQELVMPAALNLMGMVCWHVLWFRERGALSHAELAQLLTHMVIDGVRAAARAKVGAWESDADG